MPDDDDQQPNPGGGGKGLDKRDDPKGPPDENLE